MNMGMGSPASGMEKPKSEFRNLVEGLLKESNLFPVVTIPSGSEEKMSVIEAVENNELMLYIELAGETDERLDAVHCLVTINDELEKPDPDHEFVEQTIEQLKEYL